MFSRFFPVKNVSLKDYVRAAVCTCKDPDPNKSEKDQAPAPEDELSRLFSRYTGDDVIEKSWITSGTTGEETSVTTPHAWAGTD